MLLRQLLFSVLVFLSPLVCMAGTKDSLLQLLQKYPAPDTIRCERLYALIEAEQDNTVWMKYNQELQRIAEQGIRKYSHTPKLKRAYTKYLSVAYCNAGANFVYTDKYDSAIILYRKADQIAASIQSHTDRSIALQNIATAFDFIGKLDSVLHYFEQAYKEAKLSGDSSAIAYVLTDLGYAYNNLGNNELAIKYNFQALSVFEKLKDDAGMERTSFAIGRIFDNQKDYQSSLHYYRKCLELNKLIGDEIRQTLVLNSMANAYNNMQKYRDAAACVRQAIPIAKKNNNISGLATSYEIYGDIYLSAQRYDTAHYYLKESAAMFKEVDAMFAYARVVIKLADIALRENQWSLSEQYAKEGYQIAMASSYPALHKNAAEILSKVYAHRKDFAKAYEYKVIAANIADSIYFDNNRSLALKADFKFQSEKAESRIKQLAQQKKISELKSRQKTTVIYGVIAVVIILLLLAYFMFTRYKTRKENELLKMELEETERRAVIEQQKNESDLTALKSQMNPHFIFNALNSIQELYTLGDKRMANEQMGNFARLTRKILDVSGKRTITLSEEIEILSNYLALESMRFEEDFTFEIGFSDDIEEDYVQLPPMLIQPYVENSIKHGLLHKKGPKKVAVFFEINEPENLLQCTITDNGIGREAAAEINKNRATSHVSFSTSATEKRLQLLNHGRAQRIMVQYADVIDKDQQMAGTKVVIQIPK